MTLLGFTTLQGQLAAQLARPHTSPWWATRRARRTGGGGGELTLRARTARRHTHYPSYAHSMRDATAEERRRLARGAVLDDVVALALQRARTFTLFSRPLCATSSTCASSADGWCVSAGCEDWTPHIGIDAPCTLHRAHAFGWGGRRELGVLRR